MRSLQAPTSPGLRGADASLRLGNLPPCPTLPPPPGRAGTTQSMQNAQVMTTTNSVARYVVKYVTQRDQNNQVTVAPSVHNSANMQVDTKFLHNTKITRSRINEDKAHQKSNRKHQPCGRAVSFPEMQQKLLGQNEVMTTLAFVHINTMPFEQRQTTVVKLDSKGALRQPHESNNDVQSSVSTSELVRQRKSFPEERQLTSSQLLLYRNNGAKTIGCVCVDSLTGARRLCQKRDINRWPVPPPT